MIIIALFLAGIHFRRWSKCFPANTRAGRSNGPLIYISLLWQHRPHFGERRSGSEAFQASPYRRTCGFVEGEWYPISQGGYLHASGLYAQLNAVVDLWLKCKKIFVIDI